MNTVGYTELRKNLKRIMDTTTEDGQPTIITRKNRVENMILMSMTSYNELIAERDQK